MEFNVRIRFFLLIFILLGFSGNVVVAQTDSEIEKQVWTMAFLTWKMNEKWRYNQDMAWMHSFNTPVFNRYFLRSQATYGFSKNWDVTGGLIYVHTFTKSETTTNEVRPWLGTLLRWPSFGRVNIIHYLRFEERFRHTLGEEEWANNARIRYRIMTNIPINHSKLEDKTWYGQLAYEFYSSTFDVDVRFATADIHRFDGGIGYFQNFTNRYELNLIAFNSRVNTGNQYEWGSLVLFFKYRRFMNW